ncbi:MAG: hypothetical protein L0G99_07015 [Propionibacteriales bacterium]|nr:hypothetical protein [Propionibacteriales bacterium]
MDEPSTGSGSRRSSAAHQQALGPLPDTEDPEEEARGRPWAAIIGVMSVIVLVAVVGLVLWRSAPDNVGPDEAATTSVPPLVTRPPVGIVQDLECRRTAKTVSCTWTRPTTPGQEGLRWQWWPTEAPEDRHTVEEPRISDTVPGSGCVTVQAVASDGRAGEPVTACPSG